MADAEFVITDPSAPRRCVQPDIAGIAGQVAAAASANSPTLTGRLARSWRTVPGRDPGTTLVTTDVPYARYVEYGTRYMRASAPLGRALAAVRS
ncbi:MAG TPA: HK97 gp10 family phage protein [bacterium]|nr:HK97 gp10 family phage protein [bacterium]